MSMTYVAVAGEDGYLDSGTWTGNANYLYLSSDGASLGGVRFTGFPVTTATRIRPPSPIYTSRDTYTSLALRVTSDRTAVGTLTVRLTPDVAPAAFATANPPTITGPLVATLVNPGAAGTKTIPLLLGPMTLRYRRPTWPGAWALVLQWVGGNDVLIRSAEYATAQANPSLAPALVIDAVSEMSGIQGDVKAQSRVDRCPRCSRPSIREEWVMDGYS